jgi:alpha-1,3-glucosyltransferase
MLSQTFLGYFYSNKKHLIWLGLCLFGITILLRLAIALHSYSGAGNPPMYGDYEAQRHWMEITVHLRPHQWYANGTDNDLNYWGLDYPPLTAYHSWLCGIIAHWINPDWVALHSSRGIEDYHHKLYMRYTVLAADVLIFFPAICVFVYVIYRSLSLGDRLCLIFLLLTTPSLILIDHGHFQYNSISLGLAVWAVVSMLSRRYYLSCILFSLALNYKQMELYHAFPFFFFLLGKALQEDKWFLTVVKFGTCVIGTFLICWLPFLTSIGSIQQVLHRLFPFNRGLYEDKVANLWCTISVLVKLKFILPEPVLVQLSLWTTLIANVPSSYNLLRNPTPYRFLHALVSSSLSFFLFSFQVHEKSILLAVIPVTLLSVIHPFMCTWFGVVATFSMYPLLVKDGLAVPTWSLSLFNYLLNYILLPQYKTDDKYIWIQRMVRFMSIKLRRSIQL